MQITWLGHATALIDIGGTRFLTDPVLRKRLGPLVRIAEPVAAQALGRIDAVLLSHLHADHTDPATLREIGRAVPIFVPRPAARWLRRTGFENVIDLAADEETAFGGVRIRGTTAVHDGRRRPFGPSATAVGYLIGDSPSAYFAGDTDLFAGMAELGGAVDVALVPVWGWGPSLGPGHLDPERAARAVAMIAPRVAIPIHWGTLAVGWPARRPADPGRPAREFEALVGRHAPEVEVRVLRPGGRTEI